MSRSPEWYQTVMKAVSNGEMYLAMLLMGFCFSVLIKPFLRRRRTLILNGSFTAIAGCILLWITESGGVYTYSLVMLGAFLIMILLEREKALQKIFLCVVFLSIRYLSNALLAEWGFFSLWLDRNVNTAPAVDVDRILLDYILNQLLFLLLHISSLYVMVRLFTKIYKRPEELSIWELLLLLLPVLAPLLEAAIFREYIRIYSQGLDHGFIKENIPPSFGRFLFYICSYAAILLFVFLNEQVRKDREDSAMNEALEKELSGMRQTIEQTGRLYDQMRSLRHDIANHLMVMEALSDRGNSAEAEEYLSRLKKAHSDSIESLRCGDPVIDVVLSAKRDDALSKGIGFSCDFVFPKELKIDVFDLSVLLNNALDNAIRAASVGHGQISISSAAHEQFFTIVIRNSYDGPMLLTGADGLPVSTKAGDGHGLGMKLIRRIALAYHGEIDFIQREAEVELRILLHRK